MDCAVFLQALPEKAGTGAAVSRLNSMGRGASEEKTGGKDMEEKTDGNRR